MNRYSDLGQAARDVLAACGLLTTAVGNLIAVALGHPHHHLRLKGALFMYIVKDDQVDVGYEVAYSVLDAEGEVITDPAGLVVEVVSDAPAVVGVLADPADQKKGTAHFGAPGLASINATVKLADGTIVGSIGAQFTVTTGDPAAISGGTLAFDGLTEAPVPVP